MSLVAEGAHWCGYCQNMWRVDLPTTRTKTCRCGRDTEVFLIRLVIRK